MAELVAQLVATSMLDTDELPTVMCACRTLRSAIREAVTKVEFHATSTHLRIFGTMRTFSSVRSAKFRDNRNMTDATVTAMAPYCTHLTDVDMDHCVNLTDAAVAALASNAPQLTKVKMHNFNLLTDASIRALATHCAGLKCVDLSSVGFTLAGAISALASCAKLTDICYLERGEPYFCWGLSDFGTVPPPHCPLLEALTLHCTGLQRLWINDCRDLTDSAVRMLASNCTQLTNVSFRECPNLTDNGVLALASHCPELTWIDFARGPRVTDAGIEALASHCGETWRRSNLWLWFDGCPITDRAVESIAAAASTACLKLHLSECRQITDAAVRSLTSHVHGSNIISLDLSDTNITDVAVELLASHFTNVERLLLYVELNNCFNVTEAAVESFKTILGEKPGLWRVTFNLDSDSESEEEEEEEEEDEVAGEYEGIVPWSF